MEYIDQVEDEEDMQFFEDLTTLPVHKSPKRYLQDRENPFESLRDTEFKATFGFEKSTTMYILNQVKEKLEPKRVCKTYLPPHMRLFVFLDFCRSNAFQRHVGKQFHLRVDQSTVCRTVLHVAECIAELLPTFVKMPNLLEQEEISKDFFSMSGLPGCIGSVDGCHIRIKKPHEAADPPPKRAVVRRLSFNLKYKKVSFYILVSQCHFFFIYFIYL